MAEMCGVCHTPREREVIWSELDKWPDPWVHQVILHLRLLSEGKDRNYQTARSLRLTHAIIRLFLQCLVHRRYFLLTHNWAIDPTNPKEPSSACSVPRYCRRVYYSYLCIWTLGNWTLAPFHCPFDLTPHAWKICVLPLVFECSLHAAFWAWRLQQVRLDNL